MKGRDPLSAPSPILLQLLLQAGSKSLRVTGELQSARPRILPSLKARLERQTNLNFRKQLARSVRHPFLRNGELQ